MPVVWGRAAERVISLDGWNGRKFFYSAHCGPMGMKDQDPELCHDCAVHHRAFFFSCKPVDFGMFSAQSLSSYSEYNLHSRCWVSQSVTSLLAITIASSFPALCFFPCFFKSLIVTSTPSWSTEFLSLSFVIPLTRFPGVCSVSTFWGADRLSQRGSNAND